MTALSEFCAEFRVDAAEFGEIINLEKKYFLVNPEQKALIAAQQKNLVAVGIYLGEEKAHFSPSPALLELIAAKNKENKMIVDEKAAWLFLCGRDILDKGVIEEGRPTAKGFYLIQNEQDENLGYGRRGKGNMAAKNVMDRGFFLRRER